MAPLCQWASPLAEDFGLAEEVRVEAGAGVEDFEADEAVILPVEHDERLYALGRVSRDAGAAGCEPLAGEVDAGGVGGRVVGDPHVPILPCRSVAS